MITFYDWVYGIAQIAAGILAIMAGGICLAMLRASQGPELRAWRPVLIGLFLFVVEQIIGGLRTFAIVPSTGVWSWIVHVLVSGILGMLIWALVVQINVNKGAVR